MEDKRKQKMLIFFSVYTNCMDSLTIRGDILSTMMNLFKLTTKITLNSMETTSFMPKGFPFPIELYQLQRENKIQRRWRNFFHLFFQNLIVSHLKVLILASFICTLFLIEQSRYPKVTLFGISLLQVCIYSLISFIILLNLHCINTVSDLLRFNIIYHTFLQIFNVKLITSSSFID